MNQPYAIAVVGIGGVFPSAPNVDVFWENILSGYDATRSVAADRWPADPDWFAQNGAQADGVLSLKACLIDSIPLPKSDKAKTLELDELSRLSLVAAEMALEDARGSLPDRSKIATILASIALPTAEISRLSEDIFIDELANSFSPAANVPPIKAKREWRHVTGRPAEVVADALELGGFTLTLDAACASSLYAVKIACDALGDGRVDAALAGGANHADSLYTQAGFTALGALSPTGKCSPFDHKGNGLVVGEGAGFLLLKRLDDALAQGDHVYAVIRGIGLSNDVGGSLLAPDSEGQLRALRQAYSQAGWSAEDVGLVECHGTGTPMGDKTEFSSLKSFWPPKTKSSQVASTVLGSVKSQIGHLLTGAGAAGLIKVIKAIEHRTLPPMINFEKPSKGIDFKETPFKVIDRPEAWRSQQPLRAGVSAFGFGGINGHVLLEEPTSTGATYKVDATPITPVEVVITAIGMKMGQEHDLERFLLDRLQGLSASTPRPQGRWPQHSPQAIAKLDSVWGTFLSSLDVEVGEFRVPPMDMPEILLQQSLMLAAAHQATKKSTLGSKERCRRSGALIGISLDLETTNFHLRWALARMLKRLEINPQDLDARALESLRDALSRPLNSTRTLGALGSIAASRAAREFSLGGPSYAISCGELSGVRAFEVAVQAIKNKEMDSCLVGAIDLACDPRSLWAEEARRPYAKGGIAKPFDKNGCGPTVAEGALALILKSRQAAEIDGDKILAIVDGIWATSGPRALMRNLESLSQHLKGKEPEFVDVLSWADPEDDARFLKHYGSYFKNEGQDAKKQRPSALGSLSGSLGIGGATAGLASVASAILALDTKIIPSLVGQSDPLLSPKGTYFPQEASFWWHDSSAGPRLAASIGHSSGQDSHVVLLREASSSASLITKSIRAKALPSQLFLLEPTKIGALRKLAEENNDLSELALNWYSSNGQGPVGARAAIVARDQGDLLKGLSLLERCLDSNTLAIEGQSGVFYRLIPTEGKTAWVFPGSGNHYIGMGRELAALFPEVAAQVCSEAACSYQHFMPWLTQPFSEARITGWQDRALSAIENDPLAPIFSQVTFAILASRILGLFLPQPQAAIGYSLGETAALFSLGAWKARDEMFERTINSPLFTQQLRAKYCSARQVLGLDDSESFDWKVAVLNRPQEEVRAAITSSELKDVFLLIVNTPQECVIGGQGSSIDKIARKLGCETFLLNGVPTVHCKLMHPVSAAYKELHLLPTQAPQNIDFYNGYQAKAYSPTSQSAAESITENALHGFSFPKLITAAFKDDVRQFIEIGPGSSCARMINTILNGERFWARSLSIQTVGEATALLRVLAAAYVNGSPLDLKSIYQDSSNEQHKPARPKIAIKAGSTLAHRLLEPISHPTPTPVATVIAKPKDNARAAMAPSPSADTAAAALHIEVKAQDAKPLVKRALVWDNPQITCFKTLTKDGKLMSNPSPPSQLSPVIGIHPDYARDPRAQIAASIVESTRQTALAHEAYLSLMESTRQQMEALLLGGYNSSPPLAPLAEGSPAFAAQALYSSNEPNLPVAPWTKIDPDSANPLMRCEHHRDSLAWLNRAQCMEFAIGSVEKVLGPKFASVDKRQVRVRLPDEPLMLCDRMMKVEGEALALARHPESTVSGRLVTEHDVFPESWYLDHDRAPVCITVESGQADLFLCSYLGIDVVTKPDRAYRLLDATITFHRGLPRPGETIVYDIKAKRFVRQGDVYLFFFEFDGTIDGKPLITMRNGCAGFHTYAEIEASGGIVLTKRELTPISGKAPANWQPPAPFPFGLDKVESYSDSQVLAFRQHNLEGCFGPDFANLPLVRPYGLPQGRMKLFDRVPFLQAKGGRYGLGRVEAEADIYPDDWFLTCHFSDDMVMPGTLMYECCAHTLRFLLARLGFVGEEAEVAFEPRQNTPAALKCRGPVTVHTKKVLYQVDIKEIGFSPEPYVLADALMFADGKAIVRFEDMSMQITGLDELKIEKLWANRSLSPTVSKGQALELSQSSSRTLYDKESIMQFSNGKPSLAFGDEYTVFDEKRRIARLPGPPFQFLDRVTEVNQPKFVLQAGDWIEAHYDIPANEWYFAANRQNSMAYCILLEAALQPCGWLAAYAGSALRSQADLKFRNLGGTATLYKEFFPHTGTMRMRVKMTEVSEAGGMIIENFAMQIWVGDELYFDGTTYFGFFSQKALANQVGVRDAAERTYNPSAEELKNTKPIIFPLAHPLTPYDQELDSTSSACLPAKALLMMDQVDIFLAKGGAKGLGFIQGSKIVDPEEWFFKAHFYQDPVWPGSLGLEAFLQLVKFFALETWPDLASSHRFEPIALNLPHTWAYRGQVIPTNKKVTVDISITKREDGLQPLLLGHGFLRVDGIPIYEMTDFGLRLVPK